MSFVGTRFAVQSSQAAGRLRGPSGSDRCGRSAPVSLSFLRLTGRQGVRPMNPIVFALRHPITMIMLVVALVGGGASP